jgi:hypothetical protein
MAKFDREIKKNGTMRVKFESSLWLLKKKRKSFFEGKRIAAIWKRRGEKSQAHYIQDCNRINSL